MSKMQSIAKPFPNPTLQGTPMKRYLYSPAIWLRWARPQYHYPWRWNLGCENAAESLSPMEAARCWERDFEIEAILCHLVSSSHQVLRFACGPHTTFHPWAEAFCTFLTLKLAILGHFMKFQWYVHTNERCRTMSDNLCMYIYICENEFENDTMPPLGKRLPPAPLRLQLQFRCRLLAGGEKPGGVQWPGWSPDPFDIVWLWRPGKTWEGLAVTSLWRC